MNSFFKILFLALFLSSCEEKLKITVQFPKKINIQKKLSIKVSVKKTALDSLKIYLDGKKISDSSAVSLDISNYKLGKHSLTAAVFYQKKNKKSRHTIYFLAAQKPEIYTYKILKKYPHDTAAFTQGLEYFKGFIYESTGKKGKSTIRKINLKTGEILKIKKLDKQYFGEGITIFKNKIYGLTWQAKKGFVYDLETFKKIKTFSYQNSLEGWGLSHNEKYLLKTDGTEKIWFLDPENLQEKGFIAAYTNQRKVENLNEIEYIEGKIYANIWQKNTIVILNPKNGTVEGIVNLKGLTEYLSHKKLNTEAVLNGIAYDSEGKRIFVTGKYWDTIFEIKILKK